MKTLEELRNEVKANEELKKAFAEALMNGTVTEFVAAQGVEATSEEIKAALGGFAAQASDEISDEEMANVAGGYECLRDRPCPYCGNSWTIPWSGRWKCFKCGEVNPPR